MPFSFDLLVSFLTGFVWGASFVVSSDGRMDPGTAVGVISLGIQCCQAISSYCGSFRDQHTVVASTISSVDGLNGVFVKLDHVIRQPDSKFNTDTVELVVDRVNSCKGPVDDLRDELEKLRTDTHGTTLKERIHVAG